MYCGKKSYPTQQLAKDTITHINKRQSKGIKPKRVYKCDICDQWHVASQDNKATKKSRD